MLKFERLSESEKESLKKLLGRCEECGPKDPKDLEIHRIIRSWNGGAYTLRNIAVLCREHHKGRHERETMGRKG